MEPRRAIWIVDSRNRSQSASAHLPVILLAISADNSRAQILAEYDRRKRWVPMRRIIVTDEWYSNPAIERFFDDYECPASPPSWE